MAALCFTVTKEILFVFLAIVITSSAVDDEEFCSTNLFNTTTTTLQFTKEVNEYDWAVIGRYKSLSCCAKGYTKLEWYKDGRLINSFKKFTTFYRLISNNQTIISKRTVKTDSGNYTCKVYNETTYINRTISFSVLDSYSWDHPPYPVIIPNRQYYAEKGESVRMACGAFVGFNTSITSQAVWTLSGQMKFAETADNHRYTIRTMSDGILICTLTINPVTREDYVDYHCSISNAHRETLEYDSSLMEGDPPDMKYRTSFKGALITVAISVCLFGLVMSSYVHWKLEIKLFWKDRFGKLEENDKKKYDVFVCYDQKDADFALEVLVYTLEKYYNYRCFAYERDSIAGDLIPETYTENVRLSRRFLMVVSPSVAVNNWCIYALYVAVEAMLNLHSRIICVVLQEISWDDFAITNGTNDDKTLKQVLRVIPKIQWEAASSKTFAKSAHKITNYDLCESSELSNCNSNSRGSEENIIDAQKNLIKGSKRFWTALRVLLPPKRTIKLELES